jgi:hypothetical protein
MADNAILQIVKGVQKTPGDNLSAEVGLDAIDFLDTLGGFAVDAYDMKIPAMKSSAVYADSPLTDGRTLISGTLGNVNETLRVALNAGTIVQLSAMLSKLLRFKQDCNDFWDTFGQIEPVYIKHQVSGEPGPRYALLYDIDIAIDSPTNPSEPTRDITIVIEREYGWRGIAPGDNPKHWFYYANEQSQQWKSANAGLLAGTDHLAYSATITNRAEIATASTGYLQPNFMDIPAESIPGDLPALASISVLPTGAISAATTIIIGKRTKKTTNNLARTTSLNQLSVLTFNAADSSILTDTTLANDAGASRPIGGGTAQRSQTTFVTATMANRLSWSGSNYTNGLDVSIMRGRYAVFCRARVSAAASCNIQLAIQNGLSVNNGLLTAVTISDLGGGGTGATTDWGILYLGQINLPLNKRTDVGANGLGVFVDQPANFTILLRAERTSGAGSLYVNDLIFMPIDEGSVRMTSNAAATTARAWNYDNTGYYRHGDAEEFASMQQVNGERDVPEIAGSGITLSPGTINRLMFLAYVSSTNRSYITDPNFFTVRVNIVPRWSGLRDK